MNSNPKDQVFNVLQAAKYLSCSKNTIYKLIKEGKLTVIRPHQRKQSSLKASSIKCSRSAATFPKAAVSTELENCGKWENCA